MIVFAPLSSKLVQRFGTRYIATTGMVLFSAGLAVAATVTVSTGYMSSLYSAQLAKALPDGVPVSVVASARESLGAAVQTGTAVAGPAREAFVHAMSRASLLVALVAALGAVVAWRCLPAHDTARLDGAPEADGVLA
jgi:DHA2 family multidrug resistance protein-like MFS transporter